MRVLTPEYKKQINFLSGGNDDIIATIEKNFYPAKDSVRQNNFYEQFRGDNLKETCENVWNFIKDNVTYRADSIKEQKIRMPARLLADREGDCKSMALACASIMANLIDTKKGENVGFRYTSYRNDPTPTHVYCIVNNGQYILDCVWHSFNNQKQYKYKYDKIMKISTLSGINGYGSMYSGKKLRHILSSNKPEQNKQKVDKYTFDVIKFTTKALKEFAPGTPAHDALTRILHTHTDSANLINPTINGVGVKSSLKKALNDAKNNANKIAKDFKADLTEKPEWASREDYVKHLAKKAIPLFIEMRNAFLALLALNFRNYANRMLEQEKKEPNSVKRMWYVKFGGDPKALMATLEKAKNKKAFFGKPKIAISEPISLTAVTAFLAEATPIILAIQKLLPHVPGDDETKLNPDADIDNPDNAIVSDDANQGTFDSPPQEIIPKFQITPTLAIGGLALIGLGIYAYTRRNRN